MEFIQYEVVDHVAVITLDRGRPFESEPYSGQTRASVTIVLRRVRVRETVRERPELDTFAIL